MQELTLYFPLYVLLTLEHTPWLMFVFIVDQNPEIVLLMTEKISVFDSGFPSIRVIHIQLNTHGLML
jgi:hypothetical protein